MNPAVEADSLEIVGRLRRRCECPLDLPVAPLVGLQSALRLYVPLDCKPTPLE